MKALFRLKILLVLSLLVIISSCNQEKAVPVVQLTISPGEGNIFVRKSPFSYYVTIGSDAILIDVAANWFRGFLTVKNILPTLKGEDGQDDDSLNNITIISLSVTVTDQSGQITSFNVSALEMSSATKDGIVILKPGSATSLDKYFDGLAVAGEDNSYFVEVEVDGWLGAGIENAGAPLSVNKLTFSANTFK